MNIKNNIIFLLLTAFISSCYSYDNQKITIEKVTYYTEDSIPIQSTLYLPQSNLKSIIIYILSIDQERRFPDFRSKKDSIGYREILEFVSSGTGVCLLSPRVKQSINNIELMKTQTTETVATDVEKAYRFLKMQPKFSHVPIGVMGYSATGVVAAKVAARDSCIDFALLIVTPSIRIIDEADYKWTNHPETSAVPFYKSLFAEFRTFFPKDYFTYKGQVMVNSQKNPIEKQFEDCAGESIRTINHNIISKIDNYDSIQYYAKKLIKENFDTKSLTQQNLLNLTGKPRNYTADEYVDELIKFWYTPQDIDFLKWEPNDYYPKINVPTLMLFAENDINIDAKGSIENSKKIIDTYKKTNFTIQVIPNVDHGFYEPYDTISFKENNKTYTKKRSELYFQSILDWLKNMHQ